MTYSVAIMEVPKEFYDLVRLKLLAAGYHHAVDDKENCLDMIYIYIALSFK